MDYHECIVGIDLDKALNRLFILYPNLILIAIFKIIRR